MKKQVKVVISLVVLIAILILGMSLFFPAVFKGITSGTFGKADKYHKTQMSAKDILLRSDLVDDTIQLQQMIQGLIYFTLFTQDMSNKIDSGLMAFKSKGMGATPEEAVKIKVLQDYSDFIRNNNKTLTITIRMLTCFYMKDTTDLSQDVEKNMRDFGNYVNNLNEKDSILNQALISMDNFLLTNKTMKAKTAEIASLKSIRDQLLIRGIQLSGMLQDKPLCSNLLSYALSSQSGYNALQLGNQALNVIASQQQVQAIQNAQSLQSVINSQEVGFGSSQQLGVIIQSQQSVQAVQSQQSVGAALVGSVVVYSSPTLQFLYGTPGQLSKVISAQQMNAILSGAATIGSMQAVAVFSTQTLNLVLSNVDMKNALNLIGSQSSFSATQLYYLENVILGQALQNQNLGSNFVSAVNQIGSQQLGVVIPQ